MATKEFLGQKLTYMTNPQKKYLEILKTTKVSYNSFKKLLETSLENLNKPEASWTRADLIASGAQFPSPGSIITGRTVFIDLNNTFLVGYKAFLKMVSSYSFMAAYTQTVVEDTVRCKEYLYLTAYCQKCLCGWPDDDELHVATCHVSSQQLHTFLMAVIADVKADFITDLGSMLMLPERNFKDSILISRGEATIFLATQDYEKAYRSAEHLQSVLKKAKRSSSMWMYYAQGINNDHLIRPRGACFCGHQEADAAFRLISPGARRASGFIAYTKGGTDEPDIKTAPRWCPRKIASEPRKVSREDASTIIESRHPYGLFFLKDGSVYVGIDNRGGDAWTEEFPTKRKCLEWLTDAAYEI